MNNNKIEILAPCGSRETVTAAVRSGADAVYVGLQKFSARAFADNFSEEELANALAYCRLHGVKLHAAINTLVSDSEISAALEEAVKAYLAGADAFIVQDLGLAMLIKKACPEAELHASTQMTVHTPQGARFLYNAGFDRVVLAREMSRKEIAEVVSSCPVDTEVFVHGALCMCVSGQCYMSAMLGGRSGNRGRCAQPCRLPFSVKGGTGHDLSLKDNSIIQQLDDLASLGVTSAKIEGRMKRPEYVSAAVSACRTALENGSPDAEQTERLRSVFSRSGFTDGYYLAKRGKDMFGTRSKEDVTAATNRLLSEIRTQYKDEIQSNPVSFSLVLKSGSPSELTAASGEYSVKITGAEPEKAISVPLTAQRAEKQLSKTGGTAFYVQSVKMEAEEGLTLSASEMNSLRRRAVEELTVKLSAPPQRKRISVVVPKVEKYTGSGAQTFRASFSHCYIPGEFKSCEIVYVPVSSDMGSVKRLISEGFNIGIKVPRVIFGRENEISRKLRELSEIGVSDVLCGNIGTAALAVRSGLTVHGGYSLNIFNTQSLDFIEKMGLADTELSIELTAKQISAMGGGIKRGVVGYGHLPLMIMRNCPNKNGAGCEKCGGRSVITDRRSNEFTLMCDGIATELLNTDPLVISDKLNDFSSVDFISLQFTYESKSECADILNAYKSGKKLDGKLTRGLYYRGVE